MKKVLIFGNSGSGKSTFASLLAKKLSCSAFHLDEIALDQYWRHLPPEEVLPRVESILKQDSWVIDGNYRKLFYQERFEKADTIIILDIPLYISLIRCIKRAHASKRGVRRVGAHSAQKDIITLPFLYWILWKYPREVRPLLIQKIEKEYKEKVIYLRSQKEIDEFLKAQ